jgi:hypothetical protein
MCRRDFSKVIGSRVGLAARGEDAAASKPVIGFLSPAADDLRHRHVNNSVSSKM